MKPASHQTKLLPTSNELSRRLDSLRREAAEVRRAMRLARAIEQANRAREEFAHA
jgi:hypothetical protein